MCFHLKDSQLEGHSSSYCSLKSWLSSLPPFFNTEARVADFEGVHLEDVFGLRKEQDWSADAATSIFPSRQFSFLYPQPAWNMGDQSIFLSILSISLTSLNSSNIFSKPAWDTWTQNLSRIFYLIFVHVVLSRVIRVQTRLTTCNQKDDYIFCMQRA